MWSREVSVWTYDVAFTDSFLHFLDVEARQTRQYNYNSFENFKAKQWDVEGYNHVRSRWKNVVVSNIHSSIAKTVSKWAANNSLIEHKPFSAMALYVWEKQANQVAIFLNHYKQYEIRNTTSRLWTKCKNLETKLTLRIKNFFFQFLFVLPVLSKNECVVVYYKVWINSIEGMFSIIFSPHFQTHLLQLAFSIYYIHWHLCNTEYYQRKDVNIIATFLVRLDFIMENVVAAI